MVALSADRPTVRRSGDRFSRPVAAGVKIYAGAMVVLNAAGYAQPATTALNLTADGRSNDQVDNTLGGNGAVTVTVHPGIYRLNNSAGSDLIAAANIGQNAYFVDDNTVALTSGANTRSVAGEIVDIDSSGVWVRIGQAPFPM